MDYTELAGYCYGNGAASNELVTSPVHSGHFAVAFTVKTDQGGDSQTRCVRQGVLPTAAYYGAWYYIPAPATNAGNWNLFHFRTGPDLSNSHGVLDVSLINVKGGLQHAAFGMNYDALGPPINLPRANRIVVPCGIVLQARGRHDRRGGPLSRWTVAARCNEPGD